MTNIGYRNRVYKQGKLHIDRFGLGCFDLLGSLIENEIIGF
jgi:hypothetical protein